jgi:hypothetical protein
MPQSYISARFSAIDANGRPLVGGRLYTYINGTTTPQVTYQDADGLAANTNPIILDGRGEAVVFLTDGIVYTLVLKDANDALIWSQDGVSGAGETGAIPVYPTIPLTDVGSPVYVPVVGWLNWNGTEYISDYSVGFGGGGFGFKNRILNGNFQVATLGTSFGPITAASSNPYTLDQWRASIGGTASIGVTRQNAGADYGQNRVGPYSVRITSNAATTPAAADKNRFSQPIEGLNIADLGFGTLWGGSITISFWVKASIVGNYSLAIQNGGAPGFRSYVTTYPVAVAGAWEKKTVTIPVDSSGIANWARDTALGLNLIFDIGSGANSEGASNTWLSTETTRVTGSVRTISTNAATWEVSNVQLEQGTQATPFDNRPFAVEDTSCARYYETTGGSISFTQPGSAGTATQRFPVYFRVPKRAIPSVSVTVALGAVAVVSTGTRLVNFGFSGTAQAENQWSWAADARM